MTKVYKGQFTINTSYFPLSEETQSIVEIDIDETGKGTVNWTDKELNKYILNIWFDEDELVDHDPIKELPPELIVHLAQQGYEVEEYLL